MERNLASGYNFAGKRISAGANRMQEDPVFTYDTARDSKSGNCGIPVREQEVCTADAEMYCRKASSAHQPAGSDPD